MPGAREGGTVHWSLRNGDKAWEFLGSLARAGPPRITPLMISSPLWRCCKDPVHLPTLGTARKVSLPTQGFSASRVPLPAFCSPPCLWPSLYVPTFAHPAVTSWSSIPSWRSVLPYLSYLLSLCTEAPTPVCVTIIAPNASLLVMNFPVLVTLTPYRPSFPGLSSIIWIFDSPALITVGSYQCSIFNAWSSLVA